MKLDPFSRIGLELLVFYAKNQDTVDSQPIPVPLSEASAALKISLSYAEQAAAFLRRAGFIKSTRGPGGGYFLLTPAHLITVGAVCSQCHSGLKHGGTVAADALARIVEKPARQAVQNITLADILEDKAS